MAWSRADTIRKHHDLYQAEDVTLRIVLTITLIVGGALSGTPISAQSHHNKFHYLGEINKASIVMLAEVGLVTNGLAATISNGIRQVISEQSEQAARRSSDYLIFEERLLTVADPEAC